jgi:hypothetical protein
MNVPPDHIIRIRRHAFRLAAEAGDRSAVIFGQWLEEELRSIDHHMARPA